jgi:hypothetical protein
MRHGTKAKVGTGLFECKKMAAISEIWVLSTKRICKRRNVAEILGTSSNGGTYGTSISARVVSPSHRVSKGGTGRNLGTKHAGTGTTLILHDSRHYLQ